MGLDKDKGGVFESAGVGWGGGCLLREEGGGGCAGEEEVVHVVSSLGSSSWRKIGMQLSCVTDGYTTMTSVTSGDAMAGDGRFLLRLMR